MRACISGEDTVNGLMPTAVGTKQLAASSSASQEGTSFTPEFGFMFKPAMENDTDDQQRDSQQRHPCQAQSERNAVCVVRVTAQK